MSRGQSTRSSRKWVRLKCLNTTPLPCTRLRARQKRMLSAREPVRAMSPDGRQKLSHLCARIVDLDDDVRVGVAKVADYQGHPVLRAGAEAAPFRVPDITYAHQDAANVYTQARPLWQPALALHGSGAHGPCGDE